MKVKNKKSIIFILLTVVLFVGGTIAFLLTTDTFDNLFLAGTYRVATTEVFESPDNWKPGEETAKTVTMKNEGTIPVRIRISYDEEWKSFNLDNLPLDQDGEIAAIINFDNEDDWIYEDGYYYYYKELEPGEETSSFIKSVTFNPNIENSIVCSPKLDGTGNVCESTGDGYDEGKYTLTFNIEGAQENRYVSIWNLDHPIKINYLYDVLQTEAESGGLARKYTGDHHDSFTEEPSKDIYHWYAGSNAEGTQVLDKNNVIFAGHCWQMIRTTDTGGVKMIYNGEVENNQCLNNRGAHVGYSLPISQSLNSNYWYGTEFEFNNSSGVFSLSGNTEKSVWNDSTYQNLLGKYTCKSTSSTTCSTLYYVNSYNSSTSANVVYLRLEDSYSKIGTYSFNSADLFNGIGYMNNTNKYSTTKIESQKSMNILGSGNMLIGGGYSTDYYSADSVTWDSVNEVYILNNPTTISNASDTLEKYLLTFSNNKVLYYIYKVSGNRVYYYQLRNARTMNSVRYVYGDNYIDNGDGTYQIVNGTNLTYYDCNDMNNLPINKYVCVLDYDNICRDLRYVFEKTSNSFYYRPVSNNFKYSNTYSYNNGIYTLTGDVVQFYDIHTISKQNSLANAHYTCLNTSGECEVIYYVVYSYNDAWAIPMTDGTDINYLLETQFLGSDINKNDSSIKKIIETWFKINIYKYNSYIEDVIYCNDRSLKNMSGLNLNGGNIRQNITFGHYNSFADLNCSNVTDQFSVSNNLAKLNYSVGLPNTTELYLFNNNTIKNTGYNYWTMTPSYYGDGNVRNHPYLFMYYVTSTGSFSTQGDVSTSYGIRPVISLKPNIKYKSGTGTMANPYIIKTE